MATAERHHDDHHSRIPASLTFFAWSLVALVRVLVGFQPHSGQNNWHGSKVAYGGDAEAQRHWMELTYHLPIGEWYYHDLTYWGLDYPPLTAYVSWLCGAFAHRLVGPHSVALHESRHQEMDASTKAFLRATVLVLDLLVYATAVWRILREEEEVEPSESESESKSAPRRQSPSTTFLVRFVTVMLQPALILIDHGHFQYNTVALGLALWSFYFMTRPDFASCVGGSVLFVAALSFKQMTLYFAPAVFSYLLARCARSPHRPPSNRSSSSPPGWFSTSFQRRFAALGATVLLTFAALWWPFVAYGPPGTSYVSRLRHVLHRILPMERGLFESKVANIWCVLSLNPIKIRERLSPTVQPLAALALTTVLMLPSCIAMYRGAMNAPYVSESASRHSRRIWVSHQRHLLLRGTACCACAFFLASFQVHEKSLLIALAPASLLLVPPSLAEWFGIVTAWTLWPLLVLDRLQIAYVAIVGFFVFASSLRRSVLDDAPHRGPMRVVRGLSYAAMIGLHVMELFVEPPPARPDLFPVLWSVVGCGLVSCAWLALCWQLLLLPSTDRAGSVTKSKMS